MHYVILIYSNPESRALWEQTPSHDRAAGLRAYADLTAELTASGELIATEALADRGSGARITARGGRIPRTDGPFAETKEHLAGIYLVDCDSRERAIEIAAKIPEAEFGLVEVHQTRALDEFG